MLQLADVGVKGRIHICIQYVLHTSAGTIYQYCNRLPIYLLNIHIDMSYLNIDNDIISTNYRMHIAIIECISCTCTVPVSLTCGQVFGVSVQFCEPVLYILLHWFDIHPTHYPIYPIYRQYGVHSNRCAGL